MSLEEYRRKRSFVNTPEPHGAADPHAAPASQWCFVIQKHDATNLHYDLRLELDGVLKSWAVPKGPSLDPHDKRLAVHVEDHPLEYLHFEGIIPANEYGGGTVMVWDTGHWQCDDPTDYHRGELKFTLNGNKLQGRWMLVHTGRRRGDAKHWLLFKERDAWARDAETLDVLAEYPRSVLTDRTMQQIAADKDAVWTKADNQRSQPGLARAGLAGSQLPQASAEKPVQSAAGSANLPHIRNLILLLDERRSIRPRNRHSPRQPPRHLSATSGFTRSNSMAIACWELSKTDH